MARDPNSSSIAKGLKTEVRRMRMTDRRTCDASSNGPTELLQTAGFPAARIAMTVDPRWTTPEAVAGFAASPPNEVLMRFAAETAHGLDAPLALDIGCGAGRNAVALAQSGWRVVGTDLSWPMLKGAVQRVR